MTSECDLEVKNDIQIVWSKVKEKFVLHNLKVKIALSIANLRSHFFKDNVEIFIFVRVQEKILGYKKKPQETMGVDIEIAQKLIILASIHVLHTCELLRSWSMPPSRAQDLRAPFPFPYGETS